MKINGAELRGNNSNISDCLEYEQCKQQCIDHDKCQAFQFAFKSCVLKWGDDIYFHACRNTTDCKYQGGIIPERMV